MPFIDSAELEPKEPLPGWAGRFFHSPSLTFVYYSAAAGSAIHEHRHENEEVWHVVDGELEFSLDGETRRLGPGCAAVVPADTPHSVRAVTDSQAIVVDHPRRSSVGGIEI